MGEISEMMLDGTLCPGCGQFMGDGDGFPVYCSGCAKHAPRPALKRSAAPAQKRCGCGNCGRVFASIEARDQHFAQKRRTGDPRHQGEPAHKVRS